jgi:hypothetical protein
MNLFNQLPGSTRSAPGRERHVLRLLPRVLWIGTALLALPSVAFRMWAWMGAADDVAASIALLDIYAAGAVMLHWTAGLTVAIAAFTVVVMKGPAYVADPYPLPDADAPEHPESR